MVSILPDLVIVDLTFMIPFFCIINQLSIEYFDLRTLYFQYINYYIIADWQFAELL